MSRNITIQEGNRGRNFTARKLRTALQGGGTCLWVPEAELVMDELSTSKNGIFTAAKRKLFGFNSVHVYVSTIPGDEPVDDDSDEDEEDDDVEYPEDDEENEEPDDDEYIDDDYTPEDEDFVIGEEDGEDVIIEVDEDGNLIEEYLPEYIVVTVPPQKVDYMDGDSINKTGMVVVPYTKDGEVWTSNKYPLGHIPIRELVLEPATASGDFADAYLDGDPAYEEPDGQGGKEYRSNTIVSDAGRGTPTWSGSVGGGNATVEYRAPYWWITFSYGGLSEGPFIYYQGDICFYSILRADGSSEFHQSTVSSPTYGNVLILSAEETEEEIDVVIVPEDEKQTVTETITVQWERPGDGKILTDTFDITVTKWQGTGPSGKF